MRALSRLAPVSELTRSSSAITHLVLESLDTGKPYSTATVAHGFVFVSGLIPRTPAGDATKMSLPEQIKAVFGDLEGVLRACGTTKEAIVKTNCFLVDSGQFATFNDVYAEHFGAPFPARTTVVAELAAPGVLFEMDIVAALDHQGVVGSPQ